MPKIKTETYSARVEGQFFYLKTDIHVNATGEFYCEVPREFAEMSEAWESGGGMSIRLNRAKRKCIFFKELSALESFLTQSLRELNSPTIKEEHVIRYCIDSRVVFALNGEGEVTPNCTGENEQWVLGKEYGGLHANNREKGGYSLKVGAGAFTKRTITFGSSEKIEYERFYEGGTHHKRDNPAQRLNSWVGFDLPNGAKEIPYTPEAAEFFYSLMLGMAKLAKLIQENTNDEERLLELINSGQKLIRS